MSGRAYAKAGVNIALGNRVKATLPALLASAKRPEVLGQVGGFGGLFALNTRKYRQPILVSSVDGVGTKLKIAFATGRHDTIGQDLVNHCVNDIAVLGAEPLFFLDYLGTGTLKPRVFEAILRGFATACRENGCALIGGETAQMPGFYQPGEYDLSGTIVGVVEKNRMLDGRTIRPGDAILGLASSGLHTNGYSLARSILFDRMKLKPGRHVPELGKTVGEELLSVHRSYWPALKKLLPRYNSAGKPRIIKSLAHITGGGFYDNIPRTLPKRCDAVIEKGTWDLPLIYPLLQKGGRVSEAEMYHVFNMGIGMVITADASRADALLRSVRDAGVPAWRIGEIQRGTGRARIV